MSTLYPGFLFRDAHERTPMIEWYFPWGRVDWVLRAELIVWLAATVAGCWIAWRTLVRKRPWLRRDDENAP